MTNAESSIPIIRFDGEDPSIGYTDFTSVFISTSVSRTNELNTLIRHECAHIWLGHDVRGRIFRDTLQDRDKVYLHKLWNIACDLEIALHLYDDEDDRTIQTPRSYLSGGIRKVHAEKYTPSTCAEEFYENLLEDVEGQMITFLPDISEDSFDGPTSYPSDAVDVSVLMEKARQKWNESSEKERAIQVQKSVLSAFLPKPSLAGMIDRYIGRVCPQIVKTHRRPSRRTSSTNVMLRGRTTTIKSPRITIYVDRSGSFDEAKTKSSLNTLEELLTKYRGRIERDVIYFNDRLHTTDPKIGYGGTNYQPVIDSIYKDGGELSIVITDEDSAYGIVIPEKMPPVIVVGVGCISTSLSSVLGVPEFIE